MSTNAGAEKRRGKRIIGERRSAASIQSSIPVVEGTSLQDAFELFVRVKDAVAWRAK